MKLNDLYVIFEGAYKCHNNENDRSALRKYIRDILKGYGVKAAAPGDAVPDSCLIKLRNDLQVCMDTRKKNQEKNKTALAKAAAKKAEAAAAETSAKEAEEKPAAVKKAAASSSKTKTAAKTAKKEETEEKPAEKKPAVKKTAKEKSAADSSKAKKDEAPAAKAQPITSKSRNKEKQAKAEQEKLRQQEEEERQKGASQDAETKGEEDTRIINLDNASDSRVKVAKIKKVSFARPTPTPVAVKEEEPEETAAPSETPKEAEEAKPQVKETVETETVETKEPETAEPASEEKEAPAQPKEEAKTAEPTSAETETKPAGKEEAPEAKEAPKPEKEEKPQAAKPEEKKPGDVVKPVSTVSVETYVAQQENNLPRATETVPLDRLKGWRPPELGKKKSSQKTESRPGERKPAGKDASKEPAAPMGDANRKGDNRRGKKDKGKDKDKDRDRASKEEMMNRPRISSQASLRRQNADERAGEEGEYRIRRSKSKKQQTQSQPTKADIVKGDIKVSVPINIRDFSQEIGVKVGEIITVFFKMGEMLTINSILDQTHVEIAAEALGVSVQVKSKEENLEAETFSEEGFEEELTAEEVPRAPVVVFMGHVDHGKTSLIDAIRQSKVAQGESGGITQHIGAYEVDTSQGHITIIDTPGHEAFTTMRARGAKATDIAILVVAADDGIMPQTLEAINHARAANVAIIVAINKIDLPGANPDRVIRQLSENNILVEEWGGDVLCVKVSAHTKEGLDKLLEAISLQASMMSITARAEGPAEGVVLESELNPGRGTSVTLLVQKGKLKVGDPIVCETCYCKARAMMNYKGENIKVAGPSQPVQILGFTEVPQPGAKFRVAASEKLAKDLTDKRREEERVLSMEKKAGATLENFLNTINENGSSVKELPLIVKGDTKGTTEAVKAALEKLSTDEVKVKILHYAVGDVSENDVNLASASKGIIIAFKTSVTESTRALAKSKSVEIRRYDVIYHATEQIQKALLGLLEPTFHEEETGIAEVRQLFTISGTVVAGSHVVSGEIHRTDKVRVMRGKNLLFDGEIQTLKHLKDDVKEIRSGYDCGIVLNGFNDFAEGDKLHAYKMVQDGLAE